MIDGSFRELFSSNELNLYAVFQHHKYPLEYNDRYSLTKYFGVSAYKKFTFHIELELDESLPVQSIAFLHHMAIRQHRCNYHMWAIGQSSRPCPKIHIGGSTVMYAVRRGKSLLSAKLPGIIRS